MHITILTGLLCQFSSMTTCQPVAILEHLSVRRFGPSFVALVLWAVCFSSICAQETSTTAPDFQTDIAPLLRKHCTECHGNTDAELELKLTTQESLLKGSSTGTVITPGQPTTSRLIQMLDKDADEHMPPEEQLSDSDIGILSDWIAHLDKNAEVGHANSWSKKAREHWSFQPLAPPAIPDPMPQSKSRNAVDRFVESRLAAAGLTLGEPASRVTLARRLYFDLTGLPPSPEQVDAFVEDDSADAYERLVDRLLASPRYGERWGRHWLDLARYADSSGFHNDRDRPHAWRYRDYVIESFNADRPYAEFVRQQLAGDEIPSAKLEDWIATGFCRNGPSNDGNVGKSPLAREQYRLDQLDDVISTTSEVFLGLTLGCARCHDHKFDPLPQKDYYQFLAFFNNADKKDVLVEQFDAEAPKFVKSQAKGKAIVPAAMVFTGHNQRPRTTNLLFRGLASNKGPQVTAGVPIALATESQAASPQDATRAALANWIVSPENPLTWRVMANRVWQHHFGRGLAATPSNFGLLGEPPSHPELLDFLAHEFFRSGGRVKSLHRLIVTSATYRQSSRGRETEVTKDPTNVLLWRQNKRRLEAEVLRDAILAVSGSLNLKVGGPGIKPRIRANLLVSSQRNKWPHVEQEGPEHWRRSVYIYVKRQLQLPLMELFDAPPTTHSCAHRTESLVPTQALVLMNDLFVREQASRFAKRVSNMDASDDRRVALALEIALGRKPSSQRVAEGVDFCKQQTNSLLASGSTRDAAANAALIDFCHVLFNLSEFLYLE